MEILFKSALPHPPKVSFILLDWSCRESFHALDYFNDQSLPRDRYEIIWIEFYQRRAPEIAERLEADHQAGRPPAVDQWTVLDFPEDLYYHKHLMYNVGIAAGRGRIVTLCDSDVMVRPTFAQSIVEAFDNETGDDVGGAEQDSGLVLHHDEVRNVERRHYPFDRPDFDKLLAGHCINWDAQRRTTTGLLDSEDPLHTRNYGACMSALRADLIAIGGADEHTDYLGHICGPYELTWRLVNAGRREVWHPAEFLYHTWHPGTDGSLDHRGPHDGLNVSTTALASRLTGRILPLRENIAIRTLREGAAPQDAEALIARAVEQADTARMRRPPDPTARRLRVLDAPAVRNMVHQFASRARRALTTHKTPRDLARAVCITPFHFIRELLRQNTQFQINCATFLSNLDADGIEAVALFGTGDVAEKLLRLESRHKVRIAGIYGPHPGARYHGHLIQPASQIVEFQGPVVAGSRSEVQTTVNSLKQLGVTVQRIHVIL